MNAQIFYKSLADETRLKSLILLHFHRELCVCELMQALQQSQPFISRHLAQLRENGLVTDERRGKWVYYRLSPGLPGWARKILSETARVPELEYLKIRPDAGISTESAAASSPASTPVAERQLALL